MSNEPAICAYCRHRGAKGPHGLTCAAYPNGIPREILDFAADHRLPLPGDRGIQFEAREDAAEDMVAWAFRLLDQMIAEAATGVREVILDERWDELFDMAIERRCDVYRSTTDELTRRRADDECDAAEARIEALERETLAREAAGDWQAEWDELIAAAFPDLSDRES